MTYFQDRGLKRMKISTFTLLITFQFTLKIYQQAKTTNTIFFYVFNLLNQNNKNK